MNYENFAEEMLKASLAKRQRVRFEQIGKLPNRAQRDLKTAEANLDIDEEAVYTFAYLAMLRSGRALMFSEGFRPIDG